MMRVSYLCSVDKSKTIEVKDKRCMVVREIINGSNGTVEVKHKHGMAVRNNCNGTYCY